MLNRSPTPQERYLAKPFTGSSHSWALGSIDRLIARGVLAASSADASGQRARSSALDIGCGSGFIGASLRGRGIVDVDAVEVDPDARLHVADLYRRVEPTIEPFAAGAYDLVLLLDVLEHLEHPSRMLAAAAAALRPGGVLLASVPNIAHWSVRLPLLFGYFEQYDRGILDRTHLQYFTRRRFRRFLESEPTLSLRSLGATIEPAEFVLPQALTHNSAFEALSRARLSAAQALPGLLAYQHVAELERRTGG